MYRTIVILVIGILIGYFFGISTAEKGMEVDSDVTVSESTNDEVMSEDSTSEDTESSDSSNSTESEGSVLSASLSNSDVIAGNIDVIGTNDGNLVVSDQPARKGVTLDRVVLDEDSWVAVHEYKDGDLRGYIIGAKRLTAGVHENVDMWINRETMPGERFIVAIHIDDGIEGFNYRSETPRKDENGNVTVTTFTAQ